MKRIIFKSLEWLLPYTMQAIYDIYFAYLIYKWGWHVADNKNDAMDQLLK